ncbi:MAG: IS630 family transposase, partial [Pseudomonadota bacterium]
VIRVPNEIERAGPAGKVIHAILDTCAADQHATLRAWLERHPRWTFHVIPPSRSWLNAVEGAFAKLTGRRLEHGVFHSVVDLQAVIERFVQEHNETEANPFTWRATPDGAIAARNQAFQMLEPVH